MKGEVNEFPHIVKWQGNDWKWLLIHWWPIFVTVRELDPCSIWEATLGICVSHRQKNSPRPAHWEQQVPITCHTTGRDTFSLCYKGLGTKDSERSSSCSQTGHGKGRPCQVTNHQRFVAQCRTGSALLMVSRFPAPPAQGPSLPFLLEEKLELEIHSRHFCYNFFFSLYQFILVFCFPLGFHYFLSCFIIFSPITWALGGV